MLDGRTARGEDFRAFALLAEDAGFDALWTVDHLLVRPAAVAAQFGAPVSPQLAAEPPQGFWDCWTLLAALAGATSRIRLGTLVSCTGYRNPVVLANMAATLDEFSGGRLVLGLGAGNYADEHRSLGVPFDHRISRFEEALTIIGSLLRTGAVDFEGTFYTARECELRPRGPRVAGPPILVGGGEARMLRLTAQHADLWNGWIAFGDSSPEAVAPLMARVDDACAASGRDPATLGRTVSPRVEFPGDAQRPNAPGTPLSGDPHRLAASCRAFAREGISHLQLFGSWTGATLESAAMALELLDSRGE